MRWGHFLSGFLGLLVIVTTLFTGSLSFAAQLDEIRDAIRAHGKKWVAEETVISKLPDHERKVRLGLLKHARTGTEPTLSLQEPPTGIPGTPYLVPWNAYRTPISG